jgi:hypothetical protein
MDFLDPERALFYGLPPSVYFKELKGKLPHFGFNIKRLKEKQDLFL